MRKFLKVLPIPSRQSQQKYGKFQMSPHHQGIDNKLNIRKIRPEPLLMI